MSRSALALRKTPTKLPALYGTRAQLAAPGGNIEGHLALAHCDRRAGTATYALRIDNNSMNPLRARMTCLRFCGEVVPAYPLDVHVAPFSRCETLLPVRLEQVGRFDRAVVEVSGSGEVSFTLEAPAPVHEVRRFPWLRVSAATLFLGLAASFGAGAATPRIAMLAAPSRVFAGAPVEIPYAFAGWASLQYALRTRDGRQLAAGLVAAHEGTLRFNVPNAAGSNIVLSVHLAGPFGRHSSVQHIFIDAPQRRASAKAASQAPHISEFAMTTPAVHAGGPIAFAYATNALNGDIWLIDESGRLWADAPISADGSTTMTVPQAAAGRQLRAVMRARAGSQDAVASVALMVLPGLVVLNSGRVGKPAAPRALIGSSSAVLTLSSSAAEPGESVKVSIQGARGDATVALNDASGNSVETADIAQGQSSISMTAPSAAGMYYIVANVSEGVTQQTLVKKLTVH